MMKKAIPICLAAMAWPMVSSSVKAATITTFSNGDFETGSLAPWVVTPGSGNDQIMVAPTALLVTIGAGSLLTNGNFLVDFNGANSAPGGTLSQTFLTTPGTTYNVGFQFGSTTGGPERIDASVVGSTGTTLASLSAIASSPPVALTTSTFRFTANGTSATLSFLDNPGNPTVGVDGVLDNVTLTAVPEPATAGLLALAGVGFAARRRAARRV